MPTIDEQPPPPPPSPNPNSGSLPLPPVPPHPSASSSIASAEGDNDDSPGHAHALEPIRSGPSRPRSEFRYDFGGDEHEEEQQPKGVLGEIRWQLSSFWRNHICVVVPGAEARDHLALERTYLSYHRTSLALSLLSVIVSQLQILQHSSHPDPVFGFYTLGKPLAIGLILCAILISLLGWMRWWRWQRTLLRGKAMSGGWELAMTGGIGMAVILAFLGMVAAVSIRKSYFTKSHS